MKLIGVRVLFIEDVSDIRDVFAILLRSEGADVVSTASGQEGAELARSQRFDVVNRSAKCHRVVNCAGIITLGRVAAGGWCALFGHDW